MCPDNHQEIFNTGFCGIFLPYYILNVSVVNVYIFFSVSYNCFSVSSSHMVWAWCTAVSQCSLWGNEFSMHVLTLLEVWGLFKTVTRKIWNGTVIAVITGRNDSRLEFITLVEGTPDERQVRFFRVAARLYAGSLAYSQETAASS